MAGAIGLKGIHNVTGVCDLCGVACNPNKEELNALDCTYKDCPPLVYHQDCLEKYLKSIRLEKNRKTGFKCPRGCGKGTRFKECCRGKVDKSHPIHVRHETKIEKKENATQQEHPTEKHSKNKTPPIRSHTLNVHDLNLEKLVPKRSKSEACDEEWGGALQRSKSMDRSSKKSNHRNRGHRSTGSVVFHAPVPKSSRLRSSKSEVLSEAASGDSGESLRIQGEMAMKRGDVEADSPSTDSASLHDGESPEGAPPQSLPSLQEDSMRRAIQETQEKSDLQAQCKKCLINWKSGMLVQQLFRMGFEMWKAISAVHIFGSNIEEAIHWLVENREISKSHVSDIMQQHPPAEICIEFELRTLMHIRHHRQLDETQLEKAVIDNEGDVTSAIHSILGYRSNEHAFPDCDLSLGIVHSESPPFLGSAADGLPLPHTTEETPQKSLETLSDDLMLGCVLGNALDAYKRGHADFTDLANQDLSCTTTTVTTPSTYHTSAPSSMNSPLSPPTFSPPSLLHDYRHLYPFATPDHYGMPFGEKTEASTASELRHFIGDLLE